MAVSGIPQPNHRVALVDDDEWLRRALGGLLRASGFEVDLFDGPDTFFAGLGVEPPSLVILDYQLPKTTGAAIAATLRERFGANCPPLLLISGSLDQVSTGERSQFDRVLGKPFASGLLLAAVRDLTGSRASGL